MFANFRKMPIEAAIRLAHFQQMQQAGPSMPHAAQAIFDAANAAFRAGKLPPITGSRVQPRNGGGMPPRNAPASEYSNFMRRKHPKPAAVVAKRSETIPRAGASPQEFERWIARNRPGLASDVANASRQAHAKRTITIEMKVTQ